MGSPEAFSAVPTLLRLCVYGDDKAECRLSDSQTAITLFDGVWAVGKRCDTLPAELQAGNYRIADGSRRAGGPSLCMLPMEIARLCRVLCASRATASDAAVGGFGRMSAAKHTREVRDGNPGRLPFFKSGRVNCTMHKLKFKSTELIRLVGQHPMLWDRSCVQYVNKVSKDDAWNSIFCQLYPNFNSFSREEQQILGSAITAKWRNLRDAFIRSVKRKQTAEKNYEVAKNYIYYEQLKFLLHRKKCKRDPTVTQSNIDFAENVSQESIADEVSSPLDMIEPFSAVQSTSDIAQQPLDSELSPEDLDACQLNEQQMHHQDEMQSQSQHFMERPPDFFQLHDEDTAFLASITPSVRNMSEDEKLEFRIGTLELIRKIKQMRKLEQLKRLQANRGIAKVGAESNWPQNQSGSPVKQEVE